MRDVLEAFAEMPLPLVLVAGAILGASLGSFAGCAAWRLPRRRSLAGRSLCPACGVPVPSTRNVPVLTWLMQRGRTDCCGSPLAKRYLVFELACAAAGAALATIITVVGVFALCVAAIAVLGVAGAVRARPQEDAEPPLWTLVPGRYIDADGTCVYLEAIARDADSGGPVAVWEVDDLHRTRSAKAGSFAARHTPAT